MKSKLNWSFMIIFAAVVCTMLIGVSITSKADAKEKKVSIQQSELPEVIKNAINKSFPNGRILKIQKEVEGEDPGQYDVNVSAGQKEYEVEISPDGGIIEIKECSTEAEILPAKQTRKWTTSFSQENCTFSPTGKNRFFILEPGFRLVLESSTEKVIITVLDETKKIGGVETRVIEEREMENGKLKEVSRNFFAICTEHHDVFYFGEEVDNYKDGRIISHSGQWRADDEDSSEGIIMPGTILIGARYYQEISPEAMDRAEIIADDVTLQTPAGTFKNCILTEETSGLDPDEKCYKTYAPGIGLIQDEDLLLTEYTKAK